MLMPGFFGEDLFDDWMRFPWERELDNTQRKLYGKHASHVMKTDVHEHEDHYELAIDLPGFKKDEIQLSLNHGYLTISASKGLDKDETDKKGKVIRQERYAGAMQRSYFVGEAVREDDIKARFEDGVLHLTVAKRDKVLPEKKTILIEG